MSKTSVHLNELFHDAHINGFAQTGTAIAASVPFQSLVGQMGVVETSIAYPELFQEGRLLETFEQQQRFAAVRKNLIREIEGEMCSLEQAVAYLKNFELRLIAEAVTL